MENKVIYKVVDVIDEAPDIKTLSITHLDGTLPKFIAGQFMTVYFPETKTLEGKAYSFSSAPHEPICTITVKKIGEFSGRLCAMKPGDSFTGSLPYGYFSSEYHDTELVAIAAGIGVTPIKSILTHTVEHFPLRSIRLHYSVKRVPELVFRNVFDELAQKARLSIHYHVTQDQEIPESLQKGRIDIKNVVDPLIDREYLICGTISFVRDMWKSLREHGVPEDRIYTEAFFR
jgi:ferredoxin-NADP reductase